MVKKEEQDGSGSLYDDEKFAGPAEAKNKLKESIDQVRAIFPNLKLESLFMKEMEARNSCTQLKSSCFNGVVQQLVERILNDIDTFQPDPIGDVPQCERNLCQESESLTALTIILPIAECPLDRANQKMINKKISLEKSYSFFTFIDDYIKKANEDRECKLTNRQHMKCDCEQFLLTTFSRVRAKTIKRLYTGGGRGKHNTLVVALTCFCIQHQFIMMPALKKTRDTLFCEIKQDEWPELCRLVTYPYLRDRIRLYEGRRKKRWDEASIFAHKWDAFEREMKEKFGEFFRKDGSFESKFLELSDPGQVFECINCCEEYPKKYRIICRPRAGRNDDGLRHSLCFSCVKRLAEATNDATPFSDDGLGLICIKHGCNNTLPIRLLQRYLPRKLRKMLHERMVNIVLSTAKVQGLEKCKRCGMPAICDCPKLVDKVYSCPKCGFKNCRLCDVNWDDHFGRRCEDIPIATRVRNLQRRIDERLIRRCPNCTIPFLKGEACNCVACPCGFSNCYLCLASGISHAHFCNCRRSKESEDEICPDCGKACRLFANSKKWDDRLIEQVKRESDPQVLLALAEQEKGTIQSDSSGTHTSNEFMRGFIQNNLLTRPIVQSKAEESPLPLPHWQLYHNPNRTGCRRF